MSYPATYSAWRRSAGTRSSVEKPLTLHLRHDERLPQPQELGPHDVVVKIHAVSLNYRDITMLTGVYPFPLEDGGVPCSDASGEVVATGEAVVRFAVGDRVIPVAGIQSLGATDGQEPANLGVGAPGMLREYAVCREGHLVAMPKNLSWEEGATLSCAGLTVWNSLEGLRDAPENAVALFQGTGGVSMIGLAICIAVGVRVIITSSSDEKLEAVKKLSPLVQGINYKTTKSIPEEVKRLTDGRGVNYVVSTAGFAGLIDDLESLADSGTIALVGAFGGMDANWHPAQLATLILKRAKMRGIMMGTMKDFEEMNRFIEDKKVRLDAAIHGTSFAFAEAKDAYALLASGNFRGKIVIKVAQ
ncbi:hypothetical protein Micbo1qcDRAFT_166792 [Microdochium bolleyi]|uniref:Enoyl reductase (ER) domain-containing protein n=1 Tax=Microdochium bolleyi TaxID=196109 RepID=A0A136ITG8_9PEZI|nr:hypothetical protein Micbo1qcDRAFT_166792 [Microdochium bolleyi]